MPLLLIDLDNTLVDRAAAYRAWAASYLAANGHEPDLLDAMVVADGDGLRPKPEVAEDLGVLLDLDEDEEADIVKVLRAGVVEHLGLVPGCIEALETARAAGWTPFIVSNGVTAQQEKKIHSLGLDKHVDGWVISEEEGVAKPDPRIFAIASERSGQSLEGAWHIGDSGPADVVGAQAAGIPVVYLSRGRRWDATLTEPTAVADSLPEAVTIVLAAR